MEQSRKPAINRRNCDGAAISAPRLPDGNRGYWRRDNHHRDCARRAKRARACPLTRPLSARPSGSISGVGGSGRRANQADGRPEKFRGRRRDGRGSRTCAPAPRLVRQRMAPVLREMIRLLVPGLAEAADVGTMRRLVRARRSERSARQSESVKGEPRFRRRPRRRPLSANPWQERWACRPWSSPTCATVRLASGTPNASNGSRLTASSPYALSSSPPSSPSWPSSPYCPPSHDEMAISEQCNRESSALRSDYYSTTKKTANPLNEWWTTTKRRYARSARRIARPRVCGACECVRRVSRSRFCA
jgi:hypothetical protein